VLHEKPWAAVVLAPLVEMTGMTAVMVLWSLWFPVWYSMLVYEGFFRATERPFEGCCFVWIADVKTGETVAGESPAGMKLVLPQAKLDERTEK
jgi:hypothetical protein